MIDRYDVQKFEYFLMLAKRYGTDAIKIVAGDEYSTWTVSVNEDYLLDRARR